MNNHDNKARVTMADDTNKSLTPLACKSIFYKFKNKISRVKITFQEPHKKRHKFVCLFFARVCFLFVLLAHFFLPPRILVNFQTFACDLYLKVEGFGYIGLL